LIVLVGAISYFTFFARFPSLRDVPWLNLPLVLLGALLTALGWWRTQRRPGRRVSKIVATLAFGLSLSLATLFGFYVLSYSYSLPVPTPQTLDLVEAPDFELPDQRGRLVRLSDYRGMKVVLTFYRGFW
jgi:hypothetical protein